MKRFSLLSKLAIALSIGISFAGCHWAKPVTANSPVDITRAMPSWKFIGTMKGSVKECPKVRGWEERLLFAPQKPDEEDEEDQLKASGKRSKKKSKPVRSQPILPPALEIPEDLARFCVYENHGWFQRQPPSHMDLENVAPDAVALAPAGLEETIQPRLSVQFFEQVGRPIDSSPLLQPIDERLPKVRLAFLDSFPRSDSADPHFSRLPDGCTSGHGDFLRHLGYALTCERGKCMTRITTRLALPIVRFNRFHADRTLTDTRCGGYIGSFDSLAQAINDEVRDWQAENLRDLDNPSPLILNLSLAWNGKQFGGDGTVCEMKSGPRAVYDALANAARLGALIIAAVGNDHSGLDAIPDEPLLPAGWAANPPAPGECLNPPKPLYVPLLYAVGGLRSNGQPIASLQRPHSMPGLAAYADHASLGPFIALPSWPTSTYTGTSVAAAVVSSIAAVVWHERPGDSAQDVIGLIQSPGSSDALKFASSQVVPGTSTVWRTSLCKALANARRDPDSGLTSVVCEGPASAPSGTSLMLSDLLYDGLPDDSSPRWTAISNPYPEPPPGRTFHHGSEERLYCNSGTYYVPAGEPIPDPEDLCPSDVLRDVKVESWLHPAPANEPCPSCTDPPHRAIATIEEGAPAVRSLHIEIRDSWPEALDGGGELETASLEIKSPEGLLTRYFIQNPRDHDHPRRLIFPVPATGFDSSAQVTLNWKVRVGSGYYSIRTPIFIAD